MLIVELNCDLDERLVRNVSENRLLKKPSKRNFEWSKNNIEEQVQTRRVKANEEDIKRFNADGFIQIDNTNISAPDAAQMIVEKFNL